MAGRAKFFDEEDDAPPADPAPAPARRPARRGRVSPAPPPALPGRAVAANERAVAPAVLARRPSFFAETLAPPPTEVELQEHPGTSRNGTDPDRRGSFLAKSPSRLGLQPSRAAIADPVGGPGSSHGAPPSRRPSFVGPPPLTRRASFLEPGGSSKPGSSGRPGGSGKPPLSRGPSFVSVSAGAPVASPAFAHVGPGRPTGRETPEYDDERPPFLPTAADLPCAVGPPTDSRKRHTWALVSLLLYWLSIVGALGTIPFIIWHFVSVALSGAGISLVELAWVVAGAAALLSGPIILAEVKRQLNHFRYPRMQFWIIAVLMMVPIFACDAWLSLRFVDASLYIDFVREIYEAFVIYSFYRMLVEFLKMRINIVERLTAMKPVPHPFPFNYLLPRWSMGQGFIDNVETGVNMYVILEPVCACVAVATNILGYYSGFSLSLTNWAGFTSKSYPYIVVVTNVAQCCALYCLVMFYLALHDELAPMKPVYKFIVVKAVVFFSWWQSLVIVIFQEFGLIQESTTWISSYGGSDSIAEGIQNFLICLEMLGAAIGHFYAFRDIGADDSDLCELLKYWEVDGNGNLSHKYVPEGPVKRFAFDVAAAGAVGGSSSAVGGSVPGRSSAGVSGSGISLGRRRPSVAPPGGWPALDGLGGPRRPADSSPAPQITDSSPGGGWRTALAVAQAAGKFRRASALFAARRLRESTDPPPGDELSPDVEAPRPRRTEADGGWVKSDGEEWVTPARRRGGNAVDGGPESASLHGSLPLDAAPGGSGMGMRGPGQSVPELLLDIEEADEGEASGGYRSFAPGRGRGRGRGRGGLGRA